MLKENLGAGISLDCDAIHSQVNFLQGKVLTIVEASISDKEQRKAVKDLIKSSFSDQLTWIRQLCYPEIRMMTTNEAQSIVEDFDEIQNSALNVCVD